MRDIKFRSWDKLNGEMIYSDKKEEGYLFSLESGVVKCRAEYTGQRGIGDMEWEEYIDYEDLDNLMQYTGLKDKNGVEIYEGDIIDIGNGELFVVGWHEFSKEFTFLKGNGKFPKTYRGATREEWEVKGNIYENKEFNQLT